MAGFVVCYMPSAQSAGSAVQVRRVQVRAQDTRAQDRARAVQRAQARRVKLFERSAESVE
jgi:hypothetical protein